MAEYIDIDKAIVVTDTRGRERETTVRHILDINKGVYKIDDVQPVRHGRWIDEPIKGIRYHCSICFGRFDYTWHYCPNCGTKMDGDTG